MLPGVGKRKHGTPERPQTGGFAFDERPATDEAARAAVTRFVELFVVKHKRERFTIGLLHRTRQRRYEAIQGVYEWTDPALRTTLAGNTGFPQHLRERFDDLHGIIIDGSSARHVTVAGAAVLVMGEFGAIFIADEAPVALLFAEIGSPTLLYKPATTRSRGT